MNNKTNLFYEYIYTNAGETFIENNNITKQMASHEHNMLPLGTCFCSLYNSRARLKEYINEFNYRFRRNSTLDISALNTILEDLTKISPYLKVVELEFNNIEIFKNNRILKVDLEDILDSTIDIISENIFNYLKGKYDYDEQENKKYRVETIKIYAIPSLSVIEKYINQKSEFMYSYTIKNISDLMSSSAYVLVNNKYHIKKCFLCGKYFATKHGQDRYCNNPSPTDPSKTCKNAPKVIKDNNDPINIYDDKWNNAVLKLDYYYNNTLKGRFRDGANREKDEKTKQFILDNKKKLSKIKSKLRSYVISCSEKDKKYYLKIYYDFAMQIKRNTELEPKIFKVEEPEIKLLNNFR